MQGNIGRQLAGEGASEVPCCPLWGWKLPGISGKYPQVSGVSIPQISSYIHVTPPYMCVRGALNVYLTW